MKNSYSLLLFLLSCIPFGSFASTTWKLQNVEYRVDTLSHVVIGPGTTQTTLMLEGPVKLRVFYTTTDMTDPNVNLKLIMGKDNLTSNMIDVFIVVVWLTAVAGKEIADRKDEYI